MFKKECYSIFALCFLFIVCVTTSTFATASTGGGGSSSSSGGGSGDIGRASARSSGGGSGYSSSSYSSGSSGGLSDEAFENNGWTVVCRSNKCILLCDDDGDYIVYRYNGEYADHEYLNWYVNNVWDSNEDFDYNKFLSYVNSNNKTLDAKFGNDEDDFEDDYDDYISNNRKNISAGSVGSGSGIVNNNVYNAGALNNNVNIYETYGKIIASNSSQWVKNQDGTYSLFYVDDLNNQPTIASNGFFTIVDNTNNLNINTYYFDNKGIMVTTPFITQSGQMINFASTGEVIR